MNRKQNITTWVQPEALKRKEEQGGETAGTKKGRTAGGWTEYKMDNGRTYYYHAEKQATQWTMPVDFEVVAEEEPPPPPAEAGGDDDEGGARREGEYPEEVQSSKRAKKEQRRREREAEEASRAEADAGNAAERPLLAAVQAQAAAGGGEAAAHAFTEMLTEKSRTHPQVLECEWEDAMRFFIVDRRYGAVKTLEKRKELFADWQAGRAGVERQAREAARETARRGFLALLLESPLDKGATFSRAERMLSAEPRWQALEEKERQPAFEEAVDEMKRREKQRKHERAALLQKRTEALGALFKERGVGLGAEWSAVREQEGVRTDERFTCIEEGEREEAFGAYQAQLAKEQKRAAKAGFAALLDEKHKAGALGRKSKWRDAAEEVRADPRYEALKSAAGDDAPAAAFDKWVDEVRERYVRHAKRAKALAVKCADPLAGGDDLGSFRAALAKQAAAEAEAKAAEARAKDAAAEAARAAAAAREGEPEALGTLRAELRRTLAELEEASQAVKQHVEEEEGEEGGEEGGEEEAVEALGDEALKAVQAVLLDRRREAEAEQSKKRRKAERRFRELLESVRDMALSGTSFSGWERVREVLQNEPSFTLIESEEERARLWSEYVMELEKASKGRAADKQGQPKQPADEERGKPPKDNKEKKRERDDKDKRSSGGDKERKASDKHKKEDKGGKKGKEEKGAKKRNRRSRSESSYSDSDYSDSSESSYERRRRRKRR